MSFFINKATFAKYCLTQWISKLSGSFGIHWVRQYQLNFTGLVGILNISFLPDRANFHRSRALQIILMFFTTAITCLNQIGPGSLFMRYLHNWIMVIYCLIYNKDDILSMVIYCRVDDTVLFKHQLKITALRQPWLIVTSEWKQQALPGNLCWRIYVPYRGLRIVIWRPTCLEFVCARTKYFMRLKYK